MKTWGCIHGTTWNEEKPFSCAWCYIGLPDGGPHVFEIVEAGRVDNEVSEVASLRAQVKRHVEWWVALGKVLDHYWDAVPKPDCLIEDVRQIAEEAHAKGRRAERAAIVEDIRASALALDKISDMHPIRGAIRPVIKEALLGVAEHYATGKHLTTSGEPTR